MKKEIIKKKLLSDEYVKIGKNYNKRVATRVKILARHYFSHWDNCGEAFIVERIPNKCKSIKTRIISTNWEVWKSAKKINISCK